MIINQRAIKVLALHYSKRDRNGKFTRVGKSFIERINAATVQAVLREVHSHPSTGVTLL